MAGRPVTRAQLAEAIAGLSLDDSPVAVHVSWRSFPRVDGGPATLVGAFLDRGCTLLVPTMANTLFSIPAPLDDRPARNATDYEAKDASAARDPWPGLSDIYDPSRTETDPGLGATPAYVASHPDRVRSARSGSLAAIGPLANQLMAAESDDDMFGPYRALVALGGRVLLIGVGLDRLTILHLAEVEAGRRPFIYWMRGPDGRPMRSRGGACSDGFSNLAPVVASLETTTRVGTSTWRVFPARELVATAAEAIRSSPSITRCDDPACIECPDAVAGGPIESSGDSRTLTDHGAWWP
ncbi:MAG TPA: AAC(3) family N-acetyltransferase [Acidimicrobiales bacterium]|nr:AAC(3) family N-acetyltransferase [Acidimicrobiales bacterium]